MSTRYSFVTFSDRNSADRWVVGFHPTLLNASLSGTRHGSRRVCPSDLRERPKQNSAVLSYVSAVLLSISAVLCHARECPTRVRAVLLSISAVLCHARACPNSVRAVLLSISAVIHPTRACPTRVRAVLLSISAVLYPTRVSNPASMRLNEYCVMVRAERIHGKCFTIVETTLSY